MPTRLTTLGAALAVAALALVLPPAAGGADLHGDDDRDVYVGTGGLVLPSSVDHQTRVQAASCADCTWRLSSPCVASALGNAFDSSPGCTSVVRGCPGGRLLRSWLQRPGQGWAEIGLVCLVTADPVTVADAGRAAAERAEQGIPALAPSFQPRRGVLAQVPVMFASGQPGGPVNWSTEVSGTPITVSARPTWTWRFGDGASLETSDPGDSFPSAVSHVFRRSGRAEVVVSTRWAAQFTVDGLGPYPVAETLTQVADLPVVVGEGRALLAVPTPRFFTRGEQAPQGMAE